MKIERFLAIGMSSWLSFTVPPLIAADEILFEENFNDDGEGTRYTSEGRFVSEIPDHAANGISADQEGPVYWGLNSEVSVVGVPSETPARRAVVAWHHELTAESVTEDGLEMMDATIAWLTKDKANLRVLFSPAPAGDGDTLLVDRLVANGATITDDDVAGAVPAESSFDLVIHSSNGANPSRFTNYKVPYLTYNGPDHDDELVTTIGPTETRNLGDITVADPDHPAAAGKTGEISFFTGEVILDFPGTGVPDGSSTVATYPIVDVPPITSLADIDPMVAGAVETVVDEGTIPVADMDSGNSGNFSGNGGDNEVPGNPVGSFATVATGTFNVKEAGTFGIACWVAGGARLRIDLDGNGIDDGDTVITQDTPEFLDVVVEGTSNYADVAFPAVGEYAFEWVAYSPTLDFGSELFFTFVAGADQREPLDDQNVWAPLADWEALGIDSLFLNLNGEIAVTKYEQPSQVIENRPLIVAINGPDEGGQVFGGGAFIDFEGTGFFAGAALNKFAAEVSPKSVTLNPVDVTGETGLKLRMLVAASTLDFETSDFFDVKIDPDNSGSFQDLIHFTAPSGNDKFFSDGTTDLNIALKEITYDIPDGATNLVIRIEAEATWWNEIVAFDYIRVVKEVPDPVEPSLPPLDLLVLGADDTGETGADANVLTFLRESFGADNIRYANSGSTNGSETADVIIMSSTFGSGSVRSKFHNSAVPILNWEEAIMDASADGEFGQSAVPMMKSTDTTQIALHDHPIAGDLGGMTIDLFTGGETLGSSELSAGTTSVGDGVGGAVDGLSMLFVTDAGGEVAAGAGVTDNLSPARRVAFPMTDATFDMLTNDGKQLFLNSILWAAGEIGGDSRADVVAISDGALTGQTVVDFGTLLGDSSFEFSFFAVKGGASTAIAGNATWGLKLDQWNEQGLIGLTEFGVADHVFTALDGKSVASPFDREVHVVIVNDAAAGEARLYIDGEQVGTWAGDFVLGGEVSVMAAQVESPIDPFGEGSTMNGWATYNEALTAEQIAALATTPFPEGDGGPGPELMDLTNVQRTANGFSFSLTEGVTADIEYSTDLTGWDVIAPGTSGTYEDTDAGRLAEPSGYYRGIQN